VCGRKIKGQGGQRVHYPEVAHLLTVDGFHADDAHDGLRGHAKFAFGTRQRVGVVLPKAQARADAHRVDEAAAVHPPVLGRALGRRQHELGHLGQKARLPNGLAHPFAVQVAALCQVVGKLQRLWTRGVDGAAVRCGAAGGGGSLGFARILVFLGASAYGYCASSY